MIEESVPQRWLYREGFTHSRKLLLLQWLLYGSVLLWGYKCVLLSTLVPIRFEQTIDTIYDMDKSELPLMIPDIIHENMKTDSRSVMQRIRNQSLMYTWNGTFPHWVNERHCSKFHLLNKIPSFSLFYRVDNGTGVDLHSQAEKALAINDYYFSRDLFGSSFVSFILREGSPLEVRCLEING